MDPLTKAIYNGLMEQDTATYGGVSNDTRQLAYDIAAKVAYLIGGKTGKERYVWASLIQGAWDGYCAEVERYGGVPSSEGFERNMAGYNANVRYN